MGRGSRARRNGALLPALSGMVVVAMENGGKSSDGKSRGGMR